MVLRDLCNDKDLAKKMGQTAWISLKKNRGATRRNTEVAFAIWLSNYSVK